MSKPQVASEPSMEEILSSIRKMISDDKPGPRPMPDAMGRTPFGGLGAREASEAIEPDISELTGSRTADAPAGQSPNFNSLSDALKVATALSDQRRSLQQEIASVIEKGPRNNLEALTELSQGRSSADTSSSTSARGSAAASKPSWRAEPEGDMPAATAEPKQDHLLSFDFGTVVPKREEVQPKPQASDARWRPASALSIDSASADEPATKVDDKSDAPAEARVLPLRAAPGHGQNGSAANIAAFPRPARDTSKSPDQDVLGSTAKPTSGPAFGLMGGTAATSSDPVVSEAKASAVREPSESKASITEAFAEPALKVDASKVPSEALIDAVVDLVQQQPGAMSVFTSGASFIGGVGSKKPAETLPAIVEVRDEAPEATSPKLDGAAAALLRPMLRQWLAENMERILEEALRSELSEQVKGGKTPDKS